MIGIKKESKVIIKVICCIIGICIVGYIARYGMLIFILRGGIEPSEAKMEKIFQEDKVLLETAVEYLEQTGHDDIYIHSNIFPDNDVYKNETEGYGTMFADGEDVAILDKSAAENIRRLTYREGYSVISKNGETVEFQYWENRNRGIGFVFSKDSSLSNVDYLVYSKQLDDNWYYYESDFYEWKEQNMSAGSTGSE